MDAVKEFPVNADCEEIIVLNEESVEIDNSYVPLVVEEVQLSVGLNEILVTPFAGFDNNGAEGEFEIITRFRVTTLSHPLTFVKVWVAVLLLEV